MADLSSQLSTVLDRLPFGVDDIEAANRAFQDWRASGAEEDLQIVDLWTYCYVCRYFLGKAAGDEFSHASDSDELITTAYKKVRDKRDTVNNPDRYAHWVSVVCKNTFLNYTRRNRVSESIDEDGGPNLTADSDRPAPEYGFVQEAFEAAIDRLPDYLQQPARLYFLENKGFEQISDTVGKPVPTIRTYKHKAVKRLRQDDTLRGYVDVTDL
jgi:RNA polymerase sigma factor (sigma-70 family)